MATTQLPTPRAAILDVGGMGAQLKIEQAIRRSLPMLPTEARQQVMQMLTPTSLAIMGGTLVAWAGSHLFGIGEIVDVILLVTGFALVGLSAVTGAQELYAFATGAIRARSEADLDRAAKHFASAVTILGIATISALLLRGSGKAVRARGRPQVRPMPNVGRPPVAGILPRITRPFRLPSGALGETDAWGNIAVTRNQTLNQQKLTLYHEWVHRVLSPRVAPLRQIRAQLSMSGYMRSALLRYIEEALAESYAQLRVNGLSSVIVGVRFPLAGGYVTVSQLATEGVAIGNIMLGGMLFTARVVQGHWGEAAK